MKPVIVIPAYRPDGRLCDLVGQLTMRGLRVIAVDDGSGADFEAVFDQIRLMKGVHVVRHARNLGKGAALKTGIREALSIAPDCAGVVTADADGQHAAEDIENVARALLQSPDSLVLGVRDFSKADVPFKSRWGNRITSLVFRAASGTKCPDTQTGLRGLPMAFAQECLEVPGERYEFEMNMLMRAAERKLPFHEVSIRTIYEEGNRSSHFRAVRDSARIYAGLLRFGASSGACAVVDILLFSALSGALYGAEHALLIATVLARLCSGLGNFALNGRFVFKGARDAGTLGRYALLFGAQMLTSWLLVSALSQLLPSATVAKILVDGALFFASYHVQRRFVFRSVRQRDAREMDASDMHKPMQLSRNLPTAFIRASRARPILSTTKSAQEARRYGD